MRTLRLLTIAAAFVALPAVAHSQSTPAKSDSAKVDITGKWIFSLESPFPATPTVTFIQKGDSISGQYISNALGTRNFVGTHKGGAVAFSFGAESGGQSFVMAFSGKLEDADTMKGSIDFSGMASGAFTAKRTKP